MQCESRQASISNPWYKVLLPFYWTFLISSCVSGNANSERMSSDLETIPVKVGNVFFLKYREENCCFSCPFFFSRQKKHSWEANILWKNLLNHKKLSSEDHDDSSSLTVVDFQEKLLDGEVCLLEDSPFRILRVS